MGLAVSLPTAYILHQRWPAFRSLTLPLKALFVTAATISSGVITADKSGLAYEAEHFTDAGANKMRQYATRQEREWAQLSPRDKILTWAKDNKFSLVAGSWVTSMAGIGAYLRSQPMSFSQKLVQTRVWAQGITLASLLGMAAITQIPSAGDKILEERHHAADHSWRDFVDADSSEEPRMNIKPKKSNEQGQQSSSQKKQGGKSSSEGGKQQGSSA